MPDTNAGGNGQAPTSPASPGAGTGQAPTTPPNNAAGTPASSGQNGQAPTAPSSSDNYAPPSADEWRRIQSEMAEARRDAAKYRDEIRKRDDAQLSAEQKRDRDHADLQARAAEYEARLQRQSLEIAGLRLAPSLGIADAAAAMALVQAEHAHEVKFADDGRPENIETLLKAVVKDHPLLAGAASTPSSQQQQQRPPANSGGATNPGRNAGTGGLTRELIVAMPMRERIARMAEIEAWEKAQLG